MMAINGSGCSAIGSTSFSNSSLLFMAGADGGGAGFAAGAPLVNAAREAAGCVGPGGAGAACPEVVGAGGVAAGAAGGGAQIWAILSIPNPVAVKIRNNT